MEKMVECLATIVLIFSLCILITLIVMLVVMAIHMNN